MKLTWKVNKTIPTGCPDYKPNPYTGEYPSFHCLVYHCEPITEERSLGVVTLKEAEDFVSKAPLSCYNFMFDGKAIKDERKRDTMSDPTYTITGNITGGSNIVTL